MNARRLIFTAALAAVLVPSAARALVTVEGIYGITRPPSADFSAAVSGVGNDPHLIRNSLQIAGGDLILHLGTLELGAIVDTSFRNGSATQLAVGGLAGIGGDLGNAVRIELLGEAGGQRYGDFTENRRIITASSSEEWFAYVGLRPGIAFRFNPHGPGLILGIWGFARWDLNSRNVRVSVGSADNTAPGTLDLGGTTIGAVARLGLDF